MNREPGYYWVKLAEPEDWEPAMWTGGHWVLLGAEAGDDVPAVIGDQVTPPLTRAST
jgi:hypothetical protein